MEMGELPQRALGAARRLVVKLSGFKTVFTVSSLAYCAVHWLLTHNFSIYMLSGALVFGAIVAMSIAWLFRWVSSSLT
jgi:hypothetical protein